MPRESISPPLHRAPNGDVRTGSCHVLPPHVGLPWLCRCEEDQGAGRDCLIQDFPTWEAQAGGDNDHPPAPPHPQKATGGRGDGGALPAGEVQAGLEGTGQRQGQ